MDVRARARTGDHPRYGPHDVGLSWGLRTAERQEEHWATTRTRAGRCLAFVGVPCDPCSLCAPTLSPAYAPDCHRWHAPWKREAFSGRQHLVMESAWGLPDGVPPVGSLPPLDSLPPLHGDDDVLAVAGGAGSSTPSGAFRGVCLPPPPSRASSVPYALAAPAPGPRAPPAHARESELLGSESAPSAYTASPLDFLARPLYPPAPAVTAPTTGAGPVSRTTAAASRPPSGLAARPRRASNGKTKRIASPVVRGRGRGGGPSPQQRAPAAGPTVSVNGSLSSQQVPSSAGSAVSANAARAMDNPTTTLLAATHAVTATAVGGVGDVAAPALPTAAAAAADAPAARLAATGTPTSVQVHAGTGGVGEQESKLDLVCQRLCVGAGRISHVLSKVADLSEAFSGVSQKLETRGTAIETMSHAVSGLRTAVVGALDSMATPTSTSDEEDGSDAGDEEQPRVDASENEIEPVRRSSSAANEAPRPKIRKVGTKSTDVKTASLKDSAKDSARAAVQAMEVAKNQMIRIRQHLTELVMQSISQSQNSAESYMDAASYSNVMKSCAQQEINGDEAAVNWWLSSDIIKPTKNGKHKETREQPRKTVRAETPLKAVLPHTIEALKKRALQAYFKSITVDMNNLTTRQVLTCLAKNDYTDSNGGRKAICEAMVSMYSFLGALNRVDNGDIVGAGCVVHASIGFYALASCFVRYYLECAKTGTINKPRTGTEPGWYVRWRAELLRVHLFLEKDKDVHSGLALTDGSDVNRATISTEEDEQVKIWYAKQLDNEVNYPAWLTQAIEKEEQEKQRRQQQQMQQQRQQQQQQQQ
ncbi:hypothetical protein I4F81_009558 [Pyropia yezoensis]|uniref:Uncharacterized protein n=1 Tax=Pyropia yezoensis TaxID=2788 RepID=A0ACC3CB83_PYRYE|nr:hypothetical protein I4F81_009558 [Neopyropia yezoensis]